MSSQDDSEVFHSDNEGKEPNGRRGHPGRVGHRGARLEKQVFETLEYDLLPMLDDPLLEDLHVARLEISRGFVQIEAVLAPGLESAERSFEEVQARLTRVEAWLRRELATSLHIKRMPALKLRYLPVSVSVTPPDATEADTDTEGGAA